MTQNLDPRPRGWGNTGMAMAIGVLLGVALDNWALGMIISAAVWAAIRVVRNRRRTAENGDDDI
jgi:uncharacterized membrane protein